MLECGHISHIVEMYYIFKKNSLLLCMDQTKYKVMMNKQGSTKLVNFMIPGLEGGKLEL